jgi:hypothetical protein
VQFSAALVALVTVAGVVFAGLQAGFSKTRVGVLIACLIVVAWALRSFWLLSRQRNYREHMVTRGAGLLALIIAVGTVVWPADKPEDTKAARSSCDLSTLPERADGPGETSAGLVYKVVSTNTHPNDHSAISHEIFAGGWVQQVFLATSRRISEVSAIINAEASREDPLKIRFDILDLSGKSVGGVDGTYDGATNNRDFGQRFGTPAEVRPGHLYALRVTNQSQKSIAVYTHTIDERQHVPFPVAACAYNSGDGPVRVVLSDNRGPHVLSGFVLSR